MNNIEISDSNIEISDSNIENTDDSMVWNIEDELVGSALYGYTPSWKQYVLSIERHSSSKDKVLILDMDWTIICPKSGRPRPKDIKDWRFRYPVELIRTKLQSMMEQGYIIGLISNQSKILKKKPQQGKKPNNQKSVDEFKLKVESIVQQLGLPIYFSAALEKGFYRKPRTGMWDLFIRESKMLNNQIDKKKSLFVGDAAGRKRYRYHKKDFSSSDWKFALNIGIDFQVPEVFFENSKAKIHNDLSMRDIGFEPRKFIEERQSNTRMTKVKDKVKDKLTNQDWKKCHIIMVGSPGSGKSTVTQKTLNSHRIVSFDNQETSTKTKSKKVITDTLLQRGFVVIDNTNAQPKDRQYWIDTISNIYQKLATKKSIDMNSIKPIKPCFKCIWVNTPKEMALHMNTFRSLLKQKTIPAVAVHAYFKRFVPPSMAEGFNEILELDFIPDFENKKQEKLCKTYL